MSSKKVYRAGIIPFYLKEGVIQMLFMLPSDSKYGGDCFQVAKGKREEGEEDEETAFREAKEELGLFKGNCKGAHKLGNFLGRTMIYVVEIEDPEFFGDPHFETKATKWMSPEEYHSDGRDLHKPIVRAAVRHIEENRKDSIKESLELFEYFNTSLYEMSNFNSNRTGLMNGTVMWVRTEPTGLPHVKFRFKLKHPQKGDAVFGFWGDEIQQVAGNWKLTNKELKIVNAFAGLNKQALQSHINGEIDSSDLSDVMGKNKAQLNG